MGTHKFDGSIDVTGDILKNGTVREVGTKLYLHKCTLFFGNGVDSDENVFFNVTTTSAEHITSSMYSSYAVIDLKAEAITAIDGSSSTQMLSIMAGMIPAYIYCTPYGTNLIGFKSGSIYRYDGTAVYPSFGEITSTYIVDNVVEL